jgi:hypothetical protein
MNLIEDNGYGEHIIYEMLGITNMKNKIDIYDIGWLDIVGDGKPLEFYVYYRLYGEIDDDFPDFLPSDNHLRIISIRSGRTILFDVNSYFGFYLDATFFYRNNVPQMILATIDGGTTWFCSYKIYAFPENSKNAIEIFNSSHAYYKSGLGFSKGQLLLYTDNIYYLKYTNGIYSFEIALEEYVDTEYGEMNKNVEHIISLETPPDEEDDYSTPQEGYGLSYYWLNFDDKPIYLIATDAWPKNKNIIQVKLNEKLFISTKLIDEDGKPQYTFVNVMERNCKHIKNDQNIVVFDKIGSASLYLWFDPYSRYDIEFFVNE